MTAEAEVRPTEVLEKVVKAVGNLFAGKLSERRNGDYQWVVMESDDIASLEKLRLILQRDRIRAAAGAVLRRSIEENRIRVFLNKQVAHAGHVSFCEPEGESPLGPIRVLIEAEDPFDLVNWLTGAHVEEQTR